MFRRNASTGALLALLTAASVASAQSFDTLLPENTIAYISVENLPRTIERYEKSPLEDLWTDPATKAFMDGAMKEWAKSMDKMRAETGMTVSDITDAISGQVAFAITGILGKDKDHDPNGLLLAAFKDEKKVLELIQKGQESSEEFKKLRREEEEFNGVTIIRYFDEEGNPKAQSMFVHEGLLAISQEVETLKQLIVKRAQNDGESLATQPLYRSVRDRIGARNDLVAFINGTALMAALKEAGVMDEEDEKIANALGMSALKGFGIQFSIHPDGLVFKAYMPTEGDKVGLLKLYDGKMSNLMPPRFVPDDAVGVTTMSFDILKLWNEAVRVANEIEPGSGMMAEGMLGMVKGQTGVDLKQDVFANMGDEMTFYMKVREVDEPGVMDPMQMFPLFVLTWRSKAPDKLKNAVAGLCNVGVQAGELKQQDYLGHTVWSIKAGASFTPALAVVGDHFMFAMRIEELKEAIGRYGKDELRGIVETDEFKRTLENAAPSRMAVSFSREAKGLRTGFLNMFLAAGGGPGLFDVSKLPTVETLEKYIGSSYSTVENRDDGYVFDYKLNLRPRPKAEDDD